MGGGENNKWIIEMIEKDVVNRYLILRLSIDRVSNTQI
jgi:hypothetical protein